MRPRVYADTSVLGGCEDAEFREHSLLFVQAIVHGELKLVLSEFTLRELDLAPGAVKGVIGRIPESCVEIVALTQEASELATAYVAEGAIGNRMRSDALHIALATVARVDVLVSWNFKHMVNLKRIHAYNAVNLKWGYPLLEIRTPREVLANEQR